MLGVLPSPPPVRTSEGEKAVISPPSPPALCLPLRSSLTHRRGVVQRRPTLLPSPDAPRSTPSPHALHPQEEEATGMEMGASRSARTVANVIQGTSNVRRGASFQVVRATISLS